MRIYLKLKREEKKTHTHMYKFVHELSKKNIFSNCRYGYLKESPSGELLNVANADGGVVPPVLADAD